jgi:monofunctional biosynthetic peptidoglycan transglycosylase
MQRKSRKIKKKRSWWSRFLILFLLIGLLTLAQVFIFGYVKPPLTIPVAKAWVAYALKRGARPLPHNWVALNEFSPHLRRAVLASEDQRFLHHYGFDFIELGQALRSLHEGGALRGASTISMQTARTMFLWPARSWLRKFGEAYYTLWLELVWSKEKILEFYLNSVDWGPGIHGGEAAALKYFHCHALDLDAGQAALLAAVLPGPHLWRPDRPTAAVKRRVERIRQEMEKVSLVGDSSS